MGLFSNEKVTNEDEVILDELAFNEYLISNNTSLEDYKLLTNTQKQVLLKKYDKYQNGMKAQENSLKMINAGKSLNKSGNNMIGTGCAMILLLMCVIILIVLFYAIL